jgi:hypothetical protein
MLTRPEPGVYADECAARLTLPTVCGNGLVPAAVDEACTNSVHGSADFAVAFISTVCVCAVTVVAGKLVHPAVECLACTVRNHRLLFALQQLLIDNTVV